MAFPSLYARTKNWGTEILTDTDLEAALDLIGDYINDALNSSTGHKHDGTTAEGPKIATGGLDQTGNFVFTGEFTAAHLALPEGAAVSTAASEGTLYTKDTGGQPELFFREESDGDEVQITSAGAVNTTAQIAYTDLNDTSTADETTSSTTYADTTLTHTFTPSIAGLVFANFSGVSDSAAGNALVGYALVVDGTVKHEVRFRGNATTIEFPVHLGWSGVLSAASHTIKVQFKTASGTETLLGSSNSTSRLTVSHPT